MFYSKSTNGFYSKEIHGNNIPDDSVEISYELYLTLLDGQSNGKIIKSDDLGNPVTADADELSTNYYIKLKISSIESSITKRRIRESVLGLDNGWLASKNSEIEELRNQLV